MEEFEELSEEGIEERKKRKRREMLLQRQMTNCARKNCSIVKIAGEVFGLPLQIFFKAFEDEKFISAFLDASGIKKKPNYQKQIAENTAALLKELKDKSKSMEKFL